jgi:hypothetical protein
MGIVLADERGRQIYDVCAGFSSIFLITGVYTYVYLESGASCALGLVFCRPGLAVHLEWSFLPYLHGSDHCR